MNSILNTRAAKAKKKEQKKNKKPAHRLSSTASIRATKIHRRNNNITNKKKSEIASSEMNRQNLCDHCGRPNHIARFCPGQECETCHQPGHQHRDCPLQHELRQFALWFPFNAIVRMGIDRTPLREFPGVGANLQLLRNAEATTIGGSRFHAEFNSLRLAYGGHGTIVFAIQDAETDAETLIHLRTVRQDNAQQAKIKIAAKYTILSGQLIEDNDRLASGSRQQQSPQADIHVLLYVRNLLQTTAALEVNNKKYYIEWGTRYVTRFLRAEVYVTTQYEYAYRLSHRRREMVEDPWNYFRGEQRPDRVPPPAVEAVIAVNEAPDAAELPAPAASLLMADEQQPPIQDENTVEQPLPKLDEEEAAEAIEQPINTELPPSESSDEEGENPPRIDE